MSFGDLFARDFVEPEPQPPVEHEQPEWLGPPSSELGVAVPLGLVLARSPRGVVALSHALVHSNGVQFQLVGHVGGLEPGRSNLIFHEQHAGRMGQGELPDGFLRFGLELPDGRRVSNLDEQGWRTGAAADGPSGPVLHQSGGSGSSGSAGGTSVDWSVGYWLWPFPAEGILRLYCEWPVAGLELASVEIDVAPLVEAAGAVTRLWSPEGEDVGAWTRMTGGWQSSQTSSSTSRMYTAAAAGGDQLAVLRRTLQQALDLVDRLDGPGRPAED